MASSSRIQENVIKLLADGETHDVQEMKAYLAQQGLTDYSEGQFSGSLTTLLRNGKIRKIERGIYCMKKRSEDMKKCFVVSPIGEEGSQTRANADKLFKYIVKPVCEACEFDPVRVDLLNDAGSISQNILEQLEEAELVIADVSEHNPNVFYEMGYRARTKKPMIHLKKKGEALPFDVNSIRTFEYDLTDLDSVDEIKERLTRTVESFSYVDSSEQDLQEESAETTSASMMQILYQILDNLGEIKNDIKNLGTETIGTVIRSMQASQPKADANTTLQMQLLGGLMQNPEAFIKLLEISEKFKTKK